MGLGARGGYISRVHPPPSSDRLQGRLRGRGNFRLDDLLRQQQTLLPFTPQYLARHARGTIRKIYQEDFRPIQLHRESQERPTLIQHGENDRRVPIPKRLRIKAGLWKIAVFPVKMVVYKGFGHGHHQTENSQRGGDGRKRKNGFAAIYLGRKKPQETENHA